MVIQATCLRRQTPFHHLQYQKSVHVVSALYDDVSDWLYRYYADLWNAATLRHPSMQSARPHISWSTPAFGSKFETTASTIMNKPDISFAVSARAHQAQHQTSKRSRVSTTKCLDQCCSILGSSRHAHLACSNRGDHKCWKLSVQMDNMYYTMPSNSREERTTTTMISNSTHCAWLPVKRTRATLFTQAKLIS